VSAKQSFVSRLVKDDRMAGDAVPRELRQELTGCGSSDLRHTRVTRDPTGDGSRIDPRVAQRRKPKGVTALGQAATFGVDDEGCVVPALRLVPECFVQERLPGGARQQIVATDNLRDAICCIVDDDRELVTWDAIASQNDEIAHLGLNVEA
jgi:hypothetical protein